jgi:hypothetical protein
MSVNFALLSYRNSANLGDEIQSLAARQFLPRVDALVDRDFLSEWEAEPDQHFGLILNGWFADRPERWPPPPFVTPLVTSFHVARGESLGRTGLTGTDVILDPNVASYLREWGPVGARDLDTVDVLEQAGIPAYFSGCLTLTLRRDEDATHGDDVVIVDLPSSVVDRVRQSTDRDIVVTTHRDVRTEPAEARFDKARELLGRYQRARCVLAGRLHAALPCLAFETPVVLVESDYEPGRYAGLRELVRNCPLADLLSGHFEFNVDDPAPNDLDYMPLRRSLESSVGDFVAKLQTDSASPRPPVIGLQDRLNTLWASLARAESDREALRGRIAELEAEARAAAGPTPPEANPSASAPPRLRAHARRLLDRAGIRPRTR